MLYPINNKNRLSARTLWDSALSRVNYVTLIPSPVSQLLPLDTSEPEHLCALLYSVCKTQGP